MWIENGGSSPGGGREAGLFSLKIKPLSNRSRERAVKGGIRTGLCFAVRRGLKRAVSTFLGSSIGFNRKKKRGVDKVRLSGVCRIK